VVISIASAAPISRTTRLLLKTRVPFIENGSDFKDTGLIRLLRIYRWT
jgi:hypothetical protein